MVSTRKKTYKSPPHSVKSSPGAKRKKTPAKKLQYHPTALEDSQLSDVNHDKKINEEIDVLKKKKNEEDEKLSDAGDDGQLVIDEDVSQSIESSQQSTNSFVTSASSTLVETEYRLTRPRRKSANYSESSETQPDKACDLFVIDTKPSKSIEVASMSPGNRSADEEIFEVDLSNVSAPANDVRLRLEDSDEDEDDDDVEDTDEKPSSRYENSNLEINVNHSDNSNDDNDDDDDDDDVSSNSDDNDDELSKKTIMDSDRKKTSDKEEMSENELSDMGQLFIIDKSGGNSQSMHTDTDSSELFVIDKESKKSIEASVDDESSSSSEESEDESSRPIKNRFNLSSKIKCPINAESSSYINFNPLSKTSKEIEKISQIKHLENQKVNELMKRSVLKPGFHKNQFVEPVTSKRQVKRERREERAKTKGAKWFDMAAPEMTSELKNDLSVVQMRRALDPKRFYKNNDTEALPKYFQMGRVVETAADFYHARVPKKQRKANIVEELMADAKFKQYSKRKYAEIQEKQSRTSRGAHRHMKRLKKQKK